MKQIYIIEHLEPKLGRWCMIEYKNISKNVGKNNLWFTNIKHKNKKLEKLGKVFRESVKNMKLDDACVLDPDANEKLSVKDARKFRYFIFGGILGDYPPKKRTKKELTKFIPNYEKRNIGKKQFSTDNAIYVVHEIAKGKNFDDMKFKDKIEIRTSKFSSVILPFFYPLINYKPRISPELVNFLKRKRGL